MWNVWIHESLKNLARISHSQEVLEVKGYVSEMWTQCERPMTDNESLKWTSPRIREQMTELWIFNWFPWLLELSYPQKTCGLRDDCDSCEFDV